MTTAVITTTRDPIEREHRGDPAGTPAPAPVPPRSPRTSRWFLRDVLSVLVSTPGGSIDPAPQALSGPTGGPVWAGVGQTPAPGREGPALGH